MISDISIYDFDRNEATSLLRLAKLVEAPNWTHDGGSLIINSEGRLFRVPIDAPELIEIDTDFATRCNNDHGISPDGNQIAISDSTEDGQSAI